VVKSGTVVVPTNDKRASAEISAFIRELLILIA
jgi:hypothetical protein